MEYVVAGCWMQSSHVLFFSGVLCVRGTQFYMEEALVAAIEEGAAAVAVNLIQHGASVNAINEV